MSVQAAAIFCGLAKHQEAAGSKEGRASSSAAAAFLIGALAAGSIMLLHLQHHSWLSQLLNVHYDRNK